MCLLLYALFAHVNWLDLHAYGTHCYPDAIDNSDRLLQFAVYQDSTHRGRYLPCGRVARTSDSAKVPAANRRLILHDCNRVHPCVNLIQGYRAPDKRTRGKRGSVDKGKVKLLFY